MEKNNSETKCLSYKGRPLVRSGAVIYYGNIKDNYIIKINVNSEKDIGKMKVADNLEIQMVTSTSAARGKKVRVVKLSNKNGIFEAIDLGAAWLDRANSKSA
ncbi:MAG: hypothetical protein LBJ32_04120 [Oscillospiraceae bacterium]|jgi:hypothetical protein|nr:hypothetical protein [Oscillospiraceae bacterium]